MATPPRKPRSHLNDTQRLTLQTCWQQGMISQSESVINHYRPQWDGVGLSFHVVKNWIGNRKMRRGVERKALHVRGTSSYNQFLENGDAKVNMRELKKWTKMLSDQEQQVWKQQAEAAAAAVAAVAAAGSTAAAGLDMTGASSRSTIVPIPHGYPADPVKVEVMAKTTVESKKKTKRRLIGQLEAICDGLKEYNIQVGGYMADKDSLIVTEFGPGEKFFQTMNKHREFWHYVGFGNYNSIKVSTTKEREKEKKRKELQELLNAKYSHRVGYKTRIPYAQLEGKALLVFTNSGEGAGMHSIPLKRPSSFGLSNLKALLESEWDIVMCDPTMSFHGIAKQQNAKAAIAKQQGDTSNGRASSARSDTLTDSSEEHEQHCEQLHSGEDYNMDNHATDSANATPLNLSGSGFGSRLGFPVLPLTGIPILPGVPLAAFPGIVSPTLGGSLSGFVGQPSAAGEPQEESQELSSPGGHTDGSSGEHRSVVSASESVSPVFGGVVKDEPMHRLYASATSAFSNNGFRQPRNKRKRSVPQQVFKTETPQCDDEGEEEKMCTEDE